MIYKLRDLLGVDELGGTMRLGRYACELAPGLARASAIYGTSLIHERHRHRFEFNCLYEPALDENGMRVSGRSPDGKFVEIAELPVAPVVRRRAVPSRVPVEAAAGRIRCLRASSRRRYRHKTGGRARRRRQRHGRTVPNPALE